MATHVIADTRRDKIVRESAMFLEMVVKYTGALLSRNQKAEKEAAKSIADKLSEVLPEMNVGLIHGSYRNRKNMM